MKPEQRVRGFWLALAVLTAAAITAPASAADPAPAGVAPPAAAPMAEATNVEALHNELRALRDAILDAWKRRDIDAVLAHVDPDVVVTWQNGEVNRGPEAVRRFYKEMLVGEGSVLSNIESTLTVDDLSVLHGTDTAIAFGSIHDDISFKRPVAAAAFIGAGKTLALDSRWTATLVRKAGGWKLASYHVSANLFSNSVMDLSTKAAGRVAGIGGFVVGAVLALLLGWLMWRRRKASAS